MEEEIKQKIEEGSKVKIITTGQTGIVKGVFMNGAMIERDTNEARRFTTVRFDNLELLEDKDN